MLSVLEALAMWLSGRSASSMPRKKMQGIVASPLPPRTIELAVTPFLASVCKEVEYC
jgi:hypothetical protein